MKKVNVKKVFGSELKELMRLLSSSGKECYIVGGAVRDLLLGYKKFKDIDKNFKSIETLYGVGYRYTE